VRIGKRKETIHWVVTLITALVAILAYFNSRAQLKESKLANRLKLEPYIDVVGVNGKEAKKFHFLINNLGKVDVHIIYYEYVILKMNKNNIFTEHKHASDDLSTALKAGKKSPLKIELDNSILDDKPRIISPIVDIIIDPIVFIGLRIKYRREVDSRPFENTFYYYAYPDTTRSYFGTGPIKLEDMQARLWISAIIKIDEVFQF
jgi:hypothetical protein